MLPPRQGVIALVLACVCWSMPGAAQQGPAAPPRAPTGLRTQKVDPRALAQRPQPQQLLVSVTTDKTDPFVAELVTINLNPADQVVNSPWVFTVDFGDLTKATKPPGSAQLQHRYRSPGTPTISVMVSPPFAAELFNQPTVQNQPMVNIHPVTLSATPAIAAVNENVLFATPLPPDDPAIRVRLAFEDGTSGDWVEGAQSTYKYATPGTYMPAVEIGLLDDGEIASVFKTDPVTLQIVDVSLVAPDSVEQGQTATLTVRFPDDPTIRYRVRFGDDSAPSDWSTAAEVAHAYTSAGTYQAVGEIGRASAAGGVTLLAGSAPQSIVINAIAAVVVPPPEPSGGGGGGLTTSPLWPYALAGLAAAALVGYSAKRALVAPRPTFTVHRPPGDSHIDTAGGLDVHLEVRLHPEGEKISPVLSGSEPLIAKWRKDHA